MRNPIYIYQATDPHPTIPEAKEVYTNGLHKKMLSRVAPHENRKEIVTFCSYSLVNKCK